MKNPLRIKITGDASDPKSLNVFDVTTGLKITNVLAIDFHLERVPSDCRVTLTVYGAEVELEASANVEAYKP